MPKPLSLLCCLILGTPLRALNEEGALIPKEALSDRALTTDWRPYTRGLHTSLCAPAVPKDLRYRLDAPEISEEGLVAVTGCDRKSQQALHTPVGPAQAR